MCGTPAKISILKGQQSTVLICLPLFPKIIFLGNSYDLRCTPQEIIASRFPREIPKSFSRKFHLPSGTCCRTPSRQIHRFETGPLVPSLASRCTSVTSSHPRWSWNLEALMVDDLPSLEQRSIAELVIVAKRP